MGIVLNKVMYTEFDWSQPLLRYLYYHVYFWFHGTKHNHKESDNI